MKKRNLLSNILYVAILIALVAFLLVQFQLFKLDEGMKNIVSTVLLVVAVLSVALVEIVFPVIDNRELLKERKYLILLIVKSVLFVGSLVFLFLYQPFGIIKSTGVAVIGFVLLYFIQFFISLDPKPVLEKEDDEEYDDEDGAETDNLETEGDSDAAEYEDAE